MSPAPLTARPGREPLTASQAGEPLAAGPGGDKLTAAGRLAGTRPVTWVPWPGAEESCRVPPSAASRSAMPCRPEPGGAAAGSKPAPSSLTVNAR